MNLNIAIIAEKLKKNPYVAVFRQNSYAANLCEIRLLDVENPVFIESSIYLGTLDEFKQLEDVPTDIDFCLQGDVREMASLAEKHRCNIMGFRGRSTIPAMFNEIVSIFEEFNQWEKSMGELIENQAPLQEFVDVAYPVVGYPITILDSSYKTLGVTRYASNDPAWVSIMSGGITRDHQSKDVLIFANLTPDDPEWQETMEHLPEGTIFFEEIIRMKKRKPLEMYSTFSNRIVLSAPLIVNRHTVAVLGLHQAMPGKESFSPGSVYIMLMLAEFLERRLAQNPFDYSSRGLRHEFFLRDLIEPEELKEDSLAERSQVLDIKLVMPLYFMLIRQTKKPSGIFDPLQDFFEADHSHCISIVYDDHYVFLLDSEFDFSVVAPFLEANKLTCGVSNPFDSMKDARRYYEQAKYALGCGDTMKPQETEHHFYDYAFFYGMKHLNETMDVEELIHPSVKALRAYDIEKKQDFCNTLKQYLLCGCNTTLAAGKLHLHRNSVIYRMSHISEITKCDLDDYANLIPLIYSLLLLEYTQT